MTHASDGSSWPPLRYTARQAHGEEELKNMRTGLLVIGHGSRQPHANAEFEACVVALRQQHTAWQVSHAYVELAQPLLHEGLAAMAAACQRVVALPLFLFNAGHVKNDIPLALARARAAHPEVEFLAALPLGVHPALIQLAWKRVAEALPAQADPARTALITVGRGATDPDANAEFCRVTRLVSEGRGLAGAQPSFIGITTPRVEAVLEQVARARPERVVVAPYFLFQGRLLHDLRDRVAAFGQRYPWIKTHVAGALGAQPELFAALETRLQQAVHGGAPLPCDTCQYRAPIGGVAQNVGGLRALLWSVRHTYTHGQAMPHTHAHRAMEKHVLVCGNVDCAAGGALGLVQALRRLVKAAGRQQDIRITRTSCMGRCGEGPTVAVYPDGIWYRGVRAEDAEELVREHLLADRLVPRLVDNIMQ